MTDTDIGTTIDREVVPGRTVWRGEPGYEQARCDLVWNGLTPDRFPAVIVRPRGVDDVVSSVRFAAATGMKVKARSGGHNWTASFLRDDAMVVDLGDLDEIVVDPQARRAELGPAVEGARLQEELIGHNLFFPTGHCSDVAVGGYLLQGGWGWNGPRLGLANGLIESVQVVTAAGDVVTASAVENPDLFWAARGSGAGFPGIVTRFHLRLTPRPALRVTQSLYRREDLPALLAWATAIGPYLPHEIEMNLFVMPDLDKLAPDGFAFMNLACFAQADARAEEALLGVDTCPVRDRALIHRVAQPGTVAELYALLDGVYEKGLRFGADNMLSDAPPEQIAACVLAMTDDFPGPRSHVLWHPYPAERVAADGSMAIMATNYLVGYGASADPADDERVQSWATRHMRAFEPLAAGMQLGDENLAARPHATIVKPGAAERLETVRRDRDPDELFYSYFRG